ncbi:YaiO family outer membrane beta-barrel protein [Alcanivorax sp. JB21]|uniref:YaiO family outer membrane beta-barrel protein n=1 Tax=Alcanivorax limicola TaxID=2874102 RepID=UPI001CC0333D|nr:YaiO family outer membrane beta-barrel protein [Alcanivorax limicola]MBZ2189363.1 YaiO family outer membrane beta-barrel protein [Alcanivorax limicola]
MIRPLILALMLVATFPAQAWEAEVRRSLENHDIPRAQAQVDAVLRALPQDRAALLWQARLNAMSGNHALARQQFDDLLRLDPNNVDVRFASAQQYAWQGDVPRAIQEAENARTLAPDYAAVWAFELQLAMTHARSADDPDAAAAYRRRHLEAQAAVPDVAAQYPAEPMQPFSWRGRRMLEIGYDEDYLSNGLSDWRGADVALQWQDSRDRLWYSRLRNTSRFDQTDNEYNAGVYVPMGNRRQLQLDATYSPTARIRPEWSAYAGFYLMPRDRWGLQPGIRRTHYDESDSTTASLLVEHYRASWRYAYTFFLTQLDGGGSGAAHVVDLRRYYRDLSHVGVGLGVGRDIESTPLGQQITDVLGVSVFGEHFLDNSWLDNSWLGPDWSVTWRIAFTEQGDAYDRIGWRLGLRYRF